MHEVKHKNKSIKALAIMSKDKPLQNERYLLNPTTSGSKTKRGFINVFLPLFRERNCCSKF